MEAALEYALTPAHGVSCQDGWFFAVLCTKTDVSVALSSEVRVGLCSGVSMSEDGAFGSAEEPLG